MLKTILKIGVMRPELLLAHFDIYQDLVIENFQAAIAKWKLRFLLMSLAVVCLFLSLLSSTFALLLWAAMPVLNEHHSWLLWMLPMFFTLMCLILFVFALHLKIEPLLQVVQVVQEQIHLDMRALNSGEKN